MKENKNQDLNKGQERQSDSDLDLRKNEDLKKSTSTKKGLEDDRSERGGQLDKDNGSDLKR